MADVVFNIAKGYIGYYTSLPAADDSLIAVPIETTGLEADATLVDYDTLAAVLAASNNEQTTMGRKTLASVASTVNDTDNRRENDFADPTWGAATGNALSAVLVCYKPASGSADGDIIPLTKHDFVVTPNGGDITATVASTGYHYSS